MKYVKKIGISLGYIIVPLIVLLFFFTILNYIGLISYKVLNVIRFILLIACIIFGSYKLGKESNSKGWLEGLKFGLIICLIFIIINYLIVHVGFNIKHIIYFGSILGSSILGSILGINKKKKEENV